jgi:SAM-dependent methyltransferase
LTLVCGDENLDFYWDVTMQGELAEKMFDETAYLEQNPDVRQGLALGHFKSGYDHYLQFGQYENRKGAAPNPLLLENTRPYPPEHLRFRVHGARDPGSYLGNGKVSARILKEAIENASVRFPDAARVLDFGCGPGRVITWFHQEHENWKFFGTDIDAEAIGWARSHLSEIATFGCNPHMPPFEYADEFFDFVYSISIFTHLPEDMQTAWLAELARVTKPGGYLVLTTHGGTLIPPEYQYLLKTGFHYSADAKTEGLPDFYQTSYQTEEYVRRVWSQFFTVERHVTRGLQNHQDVVVCRKPLRPH